MSTSMKAAKQPDSAIRWPAPTAGQSSKAASPPVPARKSAAAPTPPAPGPGRGSAAAPTPPVPGPARGPAAAPTPPVPGTGRVYATAPTPVSGRGTVTMPRDAKFFTIGERVSPRPVGQVAMSPVNNRPAVSQGVPGRGGFNGGALRMTSGPITNRNTLGGKLQRQRSASPEQQAAMNPPFRILTTGSPRSPSPPTSYPRTTPIWPGKAPSMGPFLNRPSAPSSCVDLGQGRPRSPSPPPAYPSTMTILNGKAPSAGPTINRPSTPCSAFDLSQGCISRASGSVQQSQEHTARSSLTRTRSFSPSRQRSSSVGKQSGSPPTFEPVNLTTTMLPNHSNVMSRSRITGQPVSGRQTIGVPRVASRDCMDTTLNAVTYESGPTSAITSPKRASAGDAVDLKPSLPVRQSMDVRPSISSVRHSMDVRPSLPVRQSGGSLSVTALGKKQSLGASVSLSSLNVRRSSDESAAKHSLDSTMLQGSFTLHSLDARKNSLSTTDQEATEKAEREAQNAMQRSNIPSPAGSPATTTPPQSTHNHKTSPVLSSQGSQQNQNEAPLTNFTQSNVTPQWAYLSDDEVVSLAAQTLGFAVQDLSRMNRRELVVLLASRTSSRPSVITDTGIADGESTGPGPSQSQSNSIAQSPDGSVNTTGTDGLLNRRSQVDDRGRSSTAVSNGSFLEDPLAGKKERSLSSATATTVSPCGQGLGFWEDPLQDVMAQLEFAKAEENDGRKVLREICRPPTEKGADCHQAREELPFNAPSEKAIVNPFEQCSSSGASLDGEVEALLQTRLNPNPFVPFDRSNGVSSGDLSTSRPDRVFVGQCSSDQHQELFALHAISAEELQDRAQSVLQHVKEGQERAPGSEDLHYPAVAEAVRILCFALGMPAVEPRVLHWAFESRAKAGPTGRLLPQKEFGAFYRWILEMAVEDAAANLESNR